MQKPPKLSIDLTTAQVMALDEFFAYVNHEAAAGRKGVLLAQVGHPESDKMFVNFVPQEMAAEMIRVMDRMGYERSVVSEPGECK
jgi:hypothetical protein